MRLPAFSRLINSCLGSRGGRQKRKSYIGGGSRYFAHPHFPPSPALERESSGSDLPSWSTGRADLSWGGGCQKHIRGSIRSWVEGNSIADQGSIWCENGENGRGIVEAISRLDNQLSKRTSTESSLLIPPNYSLHGIFCLLLQHVRKRLGDPPKVCSDFSANILTFVTLSEANPDYSRPLPPGLQPCWAESLSVSPWPQSSSAGRVSD